MNVLLSDPLRITAWPDEVIDRIGHQPDSAYFEWLWLPRIGPSAAWAYRRLTSGLGARPEGYSVSLEELAHWLGLGRGTGAHSVVVRTLRRLSVFHLAIQVDGSTLELRRRVPPLTQAQLARLSPHLQRTHRHLGQRPVSDPRPARAS
jgi:hypothetical protein